MNLDLTPVLDAAVKFSALAIGTLGSIALAKIGKKAGLQITAQQQADLQTKLYDATQAGGVSAELIAAQKGWDHIDVRNQVIAGGLDYAVQHFPDALKQNGIDPATVDGQAKIKNVIARMFPLAVAPIASSPLTTNGPAAAPATTTIPPATPVPATAVAPAAA